MLPERWITCHDAGFKHLLSMPGAAKAVETENNVVRSVRGGRQRTVGEREQADFAPRLTGWPFCQQPLQQPRCAVEMVFEHSLSGRVIRQRLVDKQEGQLERVVRLAA